MYYLRVVVLEREIAYSLRSSSGLVVCGGGEGGGGVVALNIGGGLRLRLAKRNFA